MVERRARRRLPPSPSPSSMDGLALFTLLYSHSLSLQLAKQLHSQASYSSIPLLLATLGANLFPSSSLALLGLAATALPQLLSGGVHSNHVLVEAALSLAVLLTVRRERSKWEAALARCLCWMLIVLYAAAGLAKLNDAWFEPGSSCCVQMAVAMLGSWSAPLAPLLATLPVLALAFEFGFAIMLLLAMACEAASTQAGRAVGHTIRRILLVSGAMFHAGIALPPPPLSVYPFTMLMAPFYALGLLPEEAGAAAQRLVTAPAHVHAGLATAVAVGCAAALRLAARAPNRFEYPPYFVWELGVLWSLIVFCALALVGLLPRTASVTTNNRISASDNAQVPSIVHGLGVLTPPVALAIIAAGPYLGVRNHPSLAMFSNLEMGGGASNHWLFRARYPTGSGSAVVEAWSGGFEFSSDNAIFLLDTDHPRLRHVQVDLAPLLPNTTRAQLAEAAASSEFYISPPAWRAAPTGPFVPVGVPVVEVRRRLAHGGAIGADFYVRYRRMEHGVPKGKELVFRTESGVRTADSDAALDEPLSPMRAMVHRFRPFDHERIVCRH